MLVIIDGVPCHIAWCTYTKQNIVWACHACNKMSRDGCLDAAFAVISNVLITTLLYIVETII